MDGWIETRAAEKREEGRIEVTFTTTTIIPCCVVVSRMTSVMATLTRGLILLLAGKQSDVTPSLTNTYLHIDREREREL